MTVVTNDGVYLLDIHIAPAEFTMPNVSYLAYIDIEMKSDYGYLSAASEYDLITVGIDEVQVDYQ